MADVKISALPAAGTLAASDVLPIVQGGTTKKTTVAEMLAAVPAAPVTSVDGRVGDVSLTDRYVQVTGGSITGPLQVSPFISVGASPAQSGSLRVPNNQWLVGRNVAGTADVRMISVSGSDTVSVGVTGTIVRLPICDFNPTELAMVDGKNLRFQSGTGTMIATNAGQKLSFYGAVPVVRPTGTPAAATDAATAMALVNDLRAKLIALGLIS